MNIKTRTEIIHQYLYTFINLDVSLIENLLDNDFCYTSAYMPNQILDKQKYLNFLKTKFEEIKSLDYEIYARSSHCIELFIKSKETKVKRIGVLRIRTDNGKIKKAFVHKGYITSLKLLKIIPA